MGNHSARVLVEFTVQHIATDEDLAQGSETVEEMARWLITEEGLLGVVEDDWRIMSVVGYRETEDA